MLAKKLRRVKICERADDQNEGGGRKKERKKENTHTHKRWKQSGKAKGVNATVSLLVANRHKGNNLLTNVEVHQKMSVVSPTEKKSFSEG